jgi:hypothetical protein
VQQLDDGLRSKKPAGIAYEVGGHMILYLLVRWLILEAALAHGIDPLQISFKNAIAELATIWQTMSVSSPEWVEKTLWPRLLQRIAAAKVAFRPGRSYPRKKKAPHKSRKSKPKKG